MRHPKKYNPHVVVQLKNLTSTNYLYWLSLAQTTLKTQHGALNLKRSNDDAHPMMLNMKHSTLDTRRWQSKFCIRNTGFLLLALNYRHSICSTQRITFEVSIRYMAFQLDVHDGWKQSWTTKHENLVSETVRYASSLSYSSKDTVLKAQIMPVNMRLSVAPQQKFKQNTQTTLITVLLWHVTNIPCELNSFVRENKSFQNVVCGTNFYLFCCNWQFFLC